MARMQPTELLDILLKNRGVTTEEEKETFLNPDYTQLHDPFLFTDMEKAVVRIFEAIEAKQKIVIYSDYDCDGIPGAVTLADFFKVIGYTHYEVYIPHRHDEGYGLHMEAIQEFIKGHVSLLITIDLGITAIQEVLEAQAHGIDVIITDHHLPKDELPRAYAILNPHLDSRYPFADLCGAGVAFKLMQGILKKYGDYWNIKPGFEKWSLDMVGLATLSDMVPLTGENRILASFGLKVLQKTRRPGLRALMSDAGLRADTVTEDDITFMITPRLNAASRMDSPERAFELLSETDSAKAVSFAKHLSSINNERKTAVALIMKEVKRVLSKREIREIIVIGNPSWRVGVLGLVASKICEEYRRPVFVWGAEGTSGDRVIKGSCRSYGTSNIIELMTRAQESFVTFGGHELAGGFAITHEHVHFLEDALLRHYVPSESVEKKVTFDTVLSLQDIHRKNYTQICKCAPFGLGNPKPLFYFQQVIIANVKVFGKEKNHLELTVQDGSTSIKAIAFFKTNADFDIPINTSDTVSILGSIEEDTYNGRSLRLRIVAITK